MATLDIGLDTSRIAAKLDVISRHAAACAAELRALDADEVELLTAWPAVGPEDAEAAETVAVDD